MTTERAKMYLCIAEGAPQNGGRAVLWTNPLALEAQWRIQCTGRCTLKNAKSGKYLSLLGDFSMGQWDSPFSISAQWEIANSTRT
mmetsp:Transcript_140466/g.365293  ORF Transcript_140466/g.365293 Transcript_140466/m.365293 type:complete len:85 (-) Transcript_140466:28-282(-)